MRRCMVMAPALEMIEVVGRPIGYRRAGSGPPLILFHGAWSDSREWRLQLEGLSDEFTVIAWDAPGCGASYDPPQGFLLSDYADLAAAFIRSLGVERPHVLGLSFGGGLAIELFRRQPRLPRSLILASAYAGWAGSLPSDVVEARVRRILVEADEPPATWIESYIPGFFAGPVDRHLIDEVIAIMCDARPAGIKSMVTAFAQADLRDALDEITVPTLLLYGERDERAPLSIAHQLNASIPTSELVVIPGVGHVCNIEAPAVFNAAVRRFLHALPG
jgi:pimeloyl-ACP methyl ester carboxylesterase